MDGGGGVGVTGRGARRQTTPHRFSLAFLFDFCCCCTAVSWSFGISIIRITFSYIDHIITPFTCCWHFLYGVVSAESRNFGISGFRNFIYRQVYDSVNFRPPEVLFLFVVVGFAHACMQRLGQHSLTCSWLFIYGPLFIAEVNKKLHSCFNPSPSLPPTSPPPLRALYPPPPLYPPPYSYAPPFLC